MIAVTIKNLSVPNTMTRDLAPTLMSGDQWAAVPDKGEHLWLKHLDTNDDTGGGLRWVVTEREWTYETRIVRGRLGIPEHRYLTTSVVLYVMDERSYQEKLGREAAVRG